MSVFVLEKVSKKFKVDKGDITILDEINLVFPNKGLISIVGKSGSGKSTLLNLLMGIEKPTSGKILFKGKNICKFNDRKFSKYHLRDLSIVFQHYNLFDNLTSFDNVVLPAKMVGLRKKKYKKRAKEIFKNLNISSLMKRKTKSLSGGEKQRIAIARALITEPSVILCDEPTGALDSKNSNEIMEIFKEYSKKILIIMVSHNLDLVKKYSDSIIELKNGKIINDQSNIQEEIIKKQIHKKYRYQNSWIIKFLLRNIKDNFLKNLFSVLACSIGFTAMFVCVGFLVGSSASQEEALKRNLSIGYATVSGVETIEIKDSPLSYQKTVRPELYQIDNVLEEFNTIRVEDNLSYFISSCCSAKYIDKTINGFEMVPVYDLSLKNYGLDLLVKGGTGNNNFDEVLVNEEFVELIGDVNINDEIIFINNSMTSFNTFDNQNPFIKDELNIERPMKIVGILKEFPFLNSPKIYYSYQGAKEFLKSESMENLSTYRGHIVSFYDYIEEVENDNEATSYSSLIFLSDLSESDEFFKKIESIKNSDIEITSNALEIKNTYNLFISSFSKTLIVFVGIAFVGINLILGMISLSTYIDNKKNTAVLTCLGGRNSSIYKIYLIENYLLIGISFIISLFLSRYLQDFLNPLISNKFALSNLIKIPFDNFFGFNYGLIILLVTISVFFSTIFSIVPMCIYRHGFISDELRDE